MEWNAACRRVIAFTVAYAVLIALVTVLVLAYGDLPRELQAKAVWLFMLILGYVALGISVGLLISLAFYIYAAVRQTREHGAPAYGHLGFWGAGAFVALWVAGLVIPSLLAVSVLRLVGCALLIAGVVHTRAWIRAKVAPGRPYAADRYDLVTGGETSSPIAAQPTADDWNASQWDPDVLKDIERRRYRQHPDR
ncbi:hypothetical protein ACQP00_39280 [Dactylosporangium sp. CS-047395]|uniref:hypothetical protein n=1 Tax=Dactylosporangium sp. CS-047395 TaxID=3239936 RepID=UPI003D8BBF88